MVFIKKLLLFSLFQTKKNSLVDTLSSKILFYNNVFSEKEEENIFYEQYLYKTIANKLSVYDKYTFYKSFQIIKISEILEYINIEDKIINLDHNNYYYFEIINSNKNIIHSYNQLVNIEDEKFPLLEDNSINIKYLKKIYSILEESSIKAEFVETFEVASLFRIKKSLLPKFKKEKFVYSVESIQNGKKANVNNNCMLITIKDSLVSYYYELKQYNNKEVLMNYYETLLMFENFLNNLDEYFDTFSFEEKHEVAALISNFKSQFPLLGKIIYNVPVEKIKGKENLTDEDFNNIMEKIINKYEYILRKKYNYKTGSVLILILSGVFNVILLKNNETEHLMPQFHVISFGRTIVDSSRICLHLPEYIPGHIQYIYFSFNEENIKNYKKFIVYWYEKFDKNYVNKTFSETKYKL